MPLKEKFLCKKYTQVLALNAWLHAWLHEKNINRSWRLPHPWGHGLDHSKVNISRNARKFSFHLMPLQEKCLCKKYTQVLALNAWLYMGKIWIGAGGCHAPGTWQNQDYKRMLICRKYWNVLFSDDIFMWLWIHLRFKRMRMCMTFWKISFSSDVFTKDQLLPPYVLVFVALNTWPCMGKIWIGAGGCHTPETWQGQDLKVIWFDDMPKCSYAETQ